MANNSYLNYDPTTNDYSWGSAYKPPEITNTPTYKAPKTLYDMTSGNSGLGENEVSAQAPGSPQGAKVGLAAFSTGMNVLGSMALGPIGFGLAAYQGYTTIKDALAEKAAVDAAMSAKATPSEIGAAYGVASQASSPSIGDVLSVGLSTVMGDWFGVTTDISTAVAENEIASNLESQFGMATSLEAARQGQLTSDYNFKVAFSKTTAQLEQELAEFEKNQEKNLQATQRTSSLYGALAPATATGTIGQALGLSSGDFYAPTTSTSELSGGWSTSSGIGTVSEKEMQTNPAVSATYTPGAQTSSSERWGNAPGAGRGGFGGFGGTGMEGSGGTGDAGPSGAGGHSDVGGI